MSENPAPSRNGLWGVFASWVLAAIVAVAIGFAFGHLERGPWLVLGFALVVVVTFVIQLVQGNPTGFISRVANSTIGALVIMGVISFVFWAIATVNA